MKTTFTLRKRLVVLVAAAALVAGAGCQQGPGGGEGPGHRAQPLALSPQQEFDLGTQAYKEVLSKADVVRSGPMVDQVERVGRRIAKATELVPLQKEINLRLKGYRFDWDFHVLRDRQVNAFCLPGGKVAVYSGLLQLVGGSDDMLAAVVGHEVAHAVAHHSSERIAREQMHRQAAEAAAGRIGDLSPHHREVLIGILTGGSKLYDLSYDRQQESEADHIGLFLMTFAGYDPEAAPRFWERMTEAAQGRGGPPEILSTHPSHAHRLAQLRSWVPQARAAKKAYDAGRVAAR